MTHTNFENLPQPTADLEIAKAHLDEFGYCLIADAGPPGIAMVFDGRTWHGTGANVSDGPRLGLLTTFIGPQFRQQENYTVGTAPEVLADASPELLALLGFKIWSGYGRLDRGSDEFITPGQKTLGEMKPE